MKTIHNKKYIQQFSSSAKEILYICGYIGELS